MPQTMVYTHFNSPVGVLLIAADEKGVCLVQFENTCYPQEIASFWLEAPDDPLLMETCKQLNEYFEGKREQFDLPLSIKGTDFQQKVWQALREIPYGTTFSYQKLAEHIGSPRAIRAVGAANGRNRIPIIIPCHRVIGSNGQLTGFAGGVEVKASLLLLENGNETENLWNEAIT